MQKSQLTKLLILALIIGGAFLAQKFGWIDKSTFDALLNGNQSNQYSNQQDNNGQKQPQGSGVEVSSTTTVRAPASVPAPAATKTRNSQAFSLPEDRGEICASGLTTTGPQDKELYNFAKGLGLSYPETFVRVSNHINQTGRLPDCYMRKREARDLGWSGGPLWGYARGRAIGGDRFGNREGRLPNNYNGKYIEADLDYDGRRRGADRLLFVQNSRGKWQQWVTVDHYDRFHRVPQN